jgi:tetratricopeptide (TPR) repeat protein
VPLRRLVDALLLVLLCVVAFLLGCYEMGDSDIWWHLGGGQWILEHGRVPGLDPFTFGSADKPWIDIHWSYEVILALTYQAGGIGALVLLGATAGGLAFLACLTARRREWPVPVTVLCWTPTLVLLAFRLDPRPEVFSLLYLGCYLAVLWRVEQRPRLAWLLLLVQVLWTNAQGLFVFGPVLLALFIAAHAAGLVGRRWRGAPAGAPGEGRWWLHVGGAGLAVVAVCLVNPYFIQGAHFPFDLFPKVADPNNPYKRYIDELMSPAEYVKDATAPVAGRNWFFMAFYFLLLLLPVSFVYPALWRAWSAAPPVGKLRRGATGTDLQLRRWLGGLVVILVLLALHTLTLSGQGAPGWVVALGDNCPLLFLVGGAAAGLLLRRRSPAAAGLACGGAATLALWMAWLQASLLGAGRGLLSGLAVGQGSLYAAAAALVAGLLVLYWGGNLFRLLLAAAFSYLALQALQNWSRFALVAGTILAWNFGEWACLLAPGAEPGKWRSAAGWALRAGLVAALGIWIAALVTDRYYVHTGEPRHIAFREQPLEFAHDAVLFAGQPGLPDRALVYDLGQTGVYVFHNAPRKKPYMDGRLEMPDRRTFETYVNVEDWLDRKDPRWEQAVAGMDNPLLLIAHDRHYAAESVLLMHPDWRCVYYDALASVFVHRGPQDSAAGFPTVDFATRHFAQPAAPSVPNLPRAAAREQRALFNLARSLPPDPELTWSRRIPLLLAALDRGAYALKEDPAQPDVWVLQGTCRWNLNPDLRVKPPGPGDDWNLERGVYLAAATYCFRRALESDPDNAAAWRYLFQAYGARGMADAQAAAGQRWLLADPKVSPQEREQVEALRRAVGPPPPPEPPPAEKLPARLADLLRHHRPAAAALLIDTAEQRGPLEWTWPAAELVGRLYVHLGRPADARRVWEQARDCPAPALRECRVGSACWAEVDFAGAIEHFRQALAEDPQCSEAWWALAMIHGQCGDAEGAAEACLRGLHSPLNNRQHADLEALKQLVQPCCHDRQVPAG